MSVHIRLSRIGKKKQPFYRIVAIDSRRARNGRFLESLGTYNPITVPAEVLVKEDRLTAWLNEGAEPSDTVSSLLTQIGFIEKYEKAKKGDDVAELTLKTSITERHKKTRKTKKAAAKAAEAAAEETVAEETAPEGDQKPESTEKETEKDDEEQKES